MSLTSTTIIPLPRALSPCVNNISDKSCTFQLAQITVEGNEFPQKEIEMDVVSEITVKPSTATPRKQSQAQTPKRKRTVSPSSPASPPNRNRNPRSTSRSTHSNSNSAPASRRSSLQSHRPTISLTPSTSSRNPEKKRETLLALHRESCRLFQEDVTVQSPSPMIMSSYFPPQPDSRTASEVSSPPGSPVFEHYDGSQSPTIHPIFRNIDSIDDDKYHDRTSKQTPITVIDWTSPTTRRREYEKIDRANRGVRGFWRRVAPKWCQSGDKRTPFFEEKDGKGNYEGSVRRFRMDIPEEETKPTRRATDLKSKFRPPRMSKRDRSNTA